VLVRGVTDGSPASVAGLRSKRFDRRHRPYAGIEHQNFREAAKGVNLLMLKRAARLLDVPHPDPLKRHEADYPSAFSEVPAFWARG